MGERLSIIIEDGPNIEARRWAARLLARIAGFPFAIGTSAPGSAPPGGPLVFYGRRPPEGCVSIAPCGYFESGSLMKTPEPGRPGEIDGIPLVFGAGEIRKKGGSVSIGADIIASAFFLASGVEEAAGGERDEHGRFPAVSSFLGKADLLDRPLLDEYALLLRRAVRRLWPRLPVTAPWGGSTLAICITHDIETLRRPNRLGYAKHKHLTALRYLAHGRLSRAASSFGAGIARGIAGGNPSWSFARMRDLETPFPGTYYFFGGRTSSHDGEYEAGSREVREVLRRLAAEGCEVGLHLGYETNADKDRVAGQKAALEAALKGRVRGARYHYLRAQMPGSWKACAEAGLEYDASLGFNEAPGFRGGTSFPYEPFDTSANRPLDIFAVPLAAMDGTFFQYEGLSAEETASQVLHLADTVACTGGVFTLLWHNTMVDPYDRPEESRAYGEIMGALKSMPAWGATVADCVAKWKSHALALEANDAGV